MTRIRIPALLATLVLLGACATTMDDESTVASASAKADKYETDAEYMARVEKEAKRRNIGVNWIHPPTRRVKKDETPR
jgi:hypothetical protein